MEDSPQKQDPNQTSDLYHKDPNRGRRRPSRRSPDGLNREDASPRSGKSRRIKNAHAEAQTPRIRNFFIILAGMGLLLWGLHAFLSKDWEHRKARARNRSIPKTEAKATHPPPPTDFGLVQHDNGTSERAVNTAQDPLSLSLIICEEADKLLAAGQADQASVRYREALGLWRTRPETWIGLGRAFLQKKSAPKAIQAFQHAVDLDPNNPDFLSELAHAHLANLQPAEAQGLLTIALGVSPDHPASLLNMALALRATQDTAGSLQYFDRYLSIKPDDSSAYRESAILMVKLNDFTNALLRLEKAIELEPTVAAYHLDASAVLAMLDRQPESLSALRAAHKHSNAQVVHGIFLQQSYNTIRSTPEGIAFLSELEKAILSRKEAAPAETSAPAENTNVPGDEPEQ